MPLLHQRVRGFFAFADCQKAVEPVGFEPFIIFHLAQVVYHEVFLSEAELFLDQLQRVVVGIVHQESFVNSQRSVWDCRNTGRNKADASGL